MGRILWYAAVTWDYIRQMLPGILLAAAVFFAVRPWRCLLYTSPSPRDA